MTVTDELETFKSNQVALEKAIIAEGEHMQYVKAQ